MTRAEMLERRRVERSRGAFTCTLCGVARPVTDYPPSAVAKGAYHCRFCRAEAKRAARLARGGTPRMVLNAQAAARRVERQAERENARTKAQAERAERAVREQLIAEERRLARRPTIAEVRRQAAETRRNSVGDPVACAVGIEPDAFWGRLLRAEGGCWEWQGDRHHAGYGRIERIVDGKRRRLAAHRVAWELVNGPINKGLFVCHRCDNPPCCNPEHLFLGTHDDNMADMVAKGRSAPLRADTIAARNRLKTACSKCGGPLEESQHASQRTSSGRGRRRCLKCKKAWQSGYMADWKRGVRRRENGK